MTSCDAEAATITGTVHGTEEASLGAAEDGAPAPPAGGARRSRALDYLEVVSAASAPESPGLPPPVLRRVKVSRSPPPVLVRPQQQCRSSWAACREASWRPYVHNMLMAIRAFNVGPLRGLERAAAAGLGNLVVLAGPNGAGKSSLLDLLRQQRHQFAEPGTTVMFVGPHRTWRSSAMSKVALFGYPMDSYGALLESDTLPHFQYVVPSGMQGLQGTLRDSASADDAQAFVKTSLGRLRDRQQSLVTTAWEAGGGQVASNSVPDLLGPFRELVRTLLPHLEFQGVDDTNAQDIAVYFRPAGQQQPLFDIDALSSGEKAAIALLLPLVERQSEQLVDPTTSQLGVVPLTMLLDEPEIHLHPLLQLQVLQYLRDLASKDIAQFILSTHSTTLLDALTDEELYLVSPASLSPENQLSRLTTSQERLEVARELTGSTHLLTRSKPIVFVEGETERGGVSSDSRLVMSLLPQTKTWALVPGRAKNDVIESVARLRQEGLELPGTPVFGLVDADTDGVTRDEHVFAWPVAMVENFLLDAHAIHSVLSPYGNQTGAVSAAVVQDALDRAAAERFDDEVHLRVQRQLPTGRLTLRPDEFLNAEEVARTGAEKWLKRLEALDLPATIEAARGEVTTIVNTGQQAERFHGKRMLQAVYGLLNVNRAGISRAALTLGVAADDLAKERAHRLAEPALRRIRLFFPAGLDLAVNDCGAGDTTKRLAERCLAEHTAWLSDSSNASGRLALRGELFALARAADGASRRVLVELAGQIGTP